MVSVSAAIGHFTQPGSSVCDKGHLGKHPACWGLQFQLDVILTEVPEGVEGPWRPRGHRDLQRVLSPSNLRVKVPRKKISKLSMCLCTADKNCLNSV